jgi:hypothetical protein
MVDAQRMLILERTDKLAQLYAVELGKATSTALDGN